jgi:PAS domain S-box-containing protein
MIDLLLEFLKSQQDWLPSYIYGAILFLIVLIVGFYFLTKKILFPAGKILYVYWKKFLLVLEIPDQFKPNGGSSLRDIIDRIHHDLVVLKKKIIYLDGENKAIMSFLGESQPPIIFWEADKNGEWISISKKWLELTSLDLKTSLGWGWLNAICEDYRDKVLELWTDSIQQKREFHSEFNIYNYLTDKEISVECHSVVVRDEFNEPLYYVGIVIPKD